MVGHEEACYWFWDCNALSWCQAPSSSPLLCPWVSERGVLGSKIGIKIFALGLRRTGQSKERKPHHVTYIWKTSWQCPETQSYRRYRNCSIDTQNNWWQFFSSSGHLSQNVWIVITAQNLNDMLIMPGFKDLRFESHNWQLRFGLLEVKPKTGKDDNKIPKVHWVQSRSLEKTFK